MHRISNLFGVQNFTLFNIMKTIDYKQQKSPTLNFDKFKVILIGVSKYPDDTHVTDVPNIKTNINLLKKTLISSNYVGISNENVLVSLNKSKSDLENELTTFVKNTSEDETLIIYYSGHGFVSDNNSELYLSTTDTKLNQLESTGISTDNFVEIINLSDSKRKIVILDSCHSGYIHNSIDNFSNYNDDKLFVISSSSSDDPSYYPINSKNLPTYFTGELIDVLKNGIENGKTNLTLNDLFNKITSSLKKQDLPSPQKTTLNGSRFYITRNNFDDEKVNKNPFVNLFTTISVLVNSFSNSINN